MTETTAEPVSVAAEAVVEADGAGALEDPPVLKFTEAHRKFSASLRSSFNTNRIEELEQTSALLVTSDRDNKKLILDQCFRELLTLELVGADCRVDLDRTKEFVQFSIQAAKKELCNPTTPIQVLADVLDMLPLASCEVLFKTIEMEVSTWRAPNFYNPIKNSLLRICNDLLRRLSRTQNMVFCGRIQLFLAKFFPFSERSGLNVVSEFNLDNITTFSKEPLDKPEDEKVEQKEKEQEKAEEEEKMEVEKGEENGTPEDEKPAESETMEIELVVQEKEKLEVEKKKEEEESRAEKRDREFQLYCKFWQLQDYFRCPTQCYQKDQWQTFCSQTADILQTFQKRKLESRASKKEDPSPGRENVSTVVDQYFAKFLTNQNLLALQLNDSNFRRYVLLQFLIIFQYLQTSVKFKTETQVLTSDQTKWIDDMRKKIFKLLEETPPNGKAFSTAVKAILKRELIWNRWKNDGCPSFIIKKEEGKEKDGKEEEGKQKEEEEKNRKRKAPLGEMMKREAKQGRINLGNKGLTKLWNLNPNNLEACRHEERNFLPSLESFFGEAIEEIDPKNQVEESYKRVNKGEWGWRALRLMSRRSQHFFLVGNSQISKLPDYLEMMMKKMATDFGTPIGTEEVEMKGSTEGTPTNGETATNGDSGDTETNGEPDTGTQKLTDEQIASLAIKLSDHWNSLLPKLGLSTEKVDECKKGENNEEITLRLLSAWLEEEGDGANQDEIRYILGALKLQDLVEGVF